MGGRIGQIWVVRENVVDVQGVNWEEEREEEEKIEECNNGGVIMEVIQFG